MSSKPDHRIAPEFVLADIVIHRIPRAEKISTENLGLLVLWDFSGDRQLFNKYFPIALELLLEEKHIKDNPGQQGSIEYSLTTSGRALQDSGGYLKDLKKRKEKELAIKKVSKAEGRKKIFDDKVKVVLFMITVLTAVVGLLGKCISDSRKPRTEIVNQPFRDSSSKQAQSVAKPESSSSTKRRRPKNTVPPDQGISRPATGNSQPEKLAENVPVRSAPTVAAPIQTATSDNIEFKIMKVVGSSKAQSVTITMVLTTSAANWYIMSSVHSIIDNGGNEYKLKSYTIGASNYFPQVVLTTGIPMRCTYTFGGVLPEVSNIKLFKYDYTHRLGEPFAVEFRDIPIEWK